MKRILTLTDFSAMAERAVDTAFTFAHQYESELLIYHDMGAGEIIEFELEENPKMDYIEQMGKDAMECISQWKKRSKELNVKASFLISADDFLVRTAKIVESMQPDLIIMGSTGAGGKREYIWGSNTEQVIKSVKCPVLVVKRAFADYRLDHIVFASSFDTREMVDLEYFLKLINPPKDSHIHLLSIDTSSFYAQPSNIVQSAIKDFEMHAKPWKTTGHFYKDYSVDSGIRHFLAEVKPDLLVMSNRIKKPVKHFLQGNNAMRLVNHTDFPVLIINFEEQ